MVDEIKTAKILDLNKLRAFKFSQPKKRGRPPKKKLVLGDYPQDLDITISYIDAEGNGRNYTFHIDNGPFKLKDMDINFKKLMVELCIKISADMCMDDPAMIVELQDWLEYSFMTREV